jgi:hypothetical protein
MRSCNFAWCFVWGMSPCWSHNSSTVYVRNATGTESEPVCSHKTFTERVRAILFIVSYLVGPSPLQLGCRKLSVIGKKQQTSIKTNSSTC